MSTEKDKKSIRKRLSGKINQIFKRKKGTNSVPVPQDIIPAANDVESLINKIKAASSWKTYNDALLFITNQGRIKQADYKDKFLSKSELKMIYGKKGGLRTICSLDSTGKYGEYCREIANNYRNLKIEDTVSAINNSNVNKVSNKQKTRLKNLIKKIGELNKKGKLEEGSSTGILIKLCGELAKKVGISDSIVDAAFKGVEGDATGPATGSVAELSKLKNELNNVNKDFDVSVKKLVNELIRFIGEIIGGSEKRQGDDVKRYDSFVNLSGELATNYLQSQDAKDIIKRSKEAVADESFVKNKAFVIDVYKILFMCTVAICSKKIDYTHCGRVNLARIADPFMKFCF